METLLLNGDDVREHAALSDVVPAVEAAFAAFARGDARMPAKSYVDLPEYNGDFRSMPAYLATETWDAAGIKWINVHPDNPERFDLPTVLGTMIYSDPETAFPLAIIDGASMNPFKTGAAGAVAVDALARPDASTVAVIGSGPQARGQLRTTATVRDLTAVRVFSPTPANRESFADEFAERLDADVTAVSSASAALAGADIVITATTASEPVIADADVEPGAHVTAMGQYAADKHELPPALIARATYVPDLTARATRDAGSFIAAREAGLVTDDDLEVELGDVVAGSYPGRTSDDEVTVFDSGGTGIETVAAAHMLYERAREAGRGTPLSIAPASEALTGL